MYSIPENAVALVTAGTSGLGLAVARLFVRQNIRVVVNYANDDERAARAIQELEEEGANGKPDSLTAPRCLALKADVSVRDNLQQMVQQVIAKMGRLDIVISNAGWTKYRNLLDLDDNVDEDDWDRCFSLNVKSHLFLLHATKQYLKRSKGSFIMTASVAGVKPSGSSIAYSVTKAAQIHLAKSLALAVAPDIRVNSVSPGFMNTDWIKDMPSNLIENARSKTLLTGITVVEDVAEQIMTLARSGSVTGANYIIDAGYSVGMP